MDLASLTTADERLVSRAVDAAERAFSSADEGRFDHDAHVVAAAVETAGGEYHVAASLPASVGRASTCAEPGAIGTAVAAGDHDFERIAAVEHPHGDETEFQIVPPCGVCRELILDYGEDVRVVVRTDSGEVGALPAVDLLPARTW